jgi:soluble lytic murein transglycosylase-like protein
VKSDQTRYCYHLSVTNCAEIAIELNGRSCKNNWRVKIDSAEGMSMQNHLNLLTCRPRSLQQLAAQLVLSTVIFVSLTLARPVSANSPDLNQRQPINDELKTELKQAILAADSFEDRFDAEVWLTAMAHKLKRYVKNPKERLTILRKVHKEAKRAGLEPELVLAVIQIESAFDPYAISVVGAQGMMQVMPFWKKEIGRVDDNLINIDTNLRYGTTILKHYIDREKGNIATGLARYNGSYGSYKYSRKVMNAWFDRWR